MIKSKEKSKELYDKKAQTREFIPGNFVFLLNETKTGKFGNHYKGPFRILEVISPKNIKIRIKNKIKVVSADRLRHSYITNTE